MINSCPIRLYGELRRKKMKTNLENLEKLMELAKSAQELSSTKEV